LRRRVARSKAAQATGLAGLYVTQGDVDTALAKVTKRVEAKYHIP